MKLMDTREAVPEAEEVVVWADAQAGDISRISSKASSSSVALIKM